MKTAAVVLVIVLSAAAAQAVAPEQPVDLTPLFRGAGLAIDRLQVYEVGGVVLIRGQATDRAVAEEAGRVAVGLGYTRIANLVRVVPPPDDAAIERLAERELTRHRSLDGCSFRVVADRGVVRVAGTVRNDLQKDYAIELLRSINGVREVHSDLQRR